jgi:hypothetical protein
MKAKYTIGILTGILLTGLTVKAQVHGKQEFRNDEARVIVNNYYDDYDYYFSSRINRFHKSYSAFSYYSPVFTDAYWYNYQPDSWGISIYGGGIGLGFSFSYPSYSYYYGNDRFYNPYFENSFYFGNTGFYFNNWHTPLVIFRTRNRWHNEFYGWNGNNHHNNYNNYNNYYNNHNNYNDRSDYRQPSNSGRSSYKNSSERNSSTTYPSTGNSSGRRSDIKPEPSTGNSFRREADRSTSTPVIRETNTTPTRRSVETTRGSSNRIQNVNSGRSSERTNVSRNERSSTPSGTAASSARRSSPARSEKSAVRESSRSAKSESKSESKSSSSSSSSEKSTRRR